MLCWLTAATQIVGLTFYYQEVVIQLIVTNNDVIIQTAILAHIVNIKRFIQTYLVNYYQVSCGWESNCLSAFSWKMPAVSIYKSSSGIHSLASHTLRKRNESSGYAATIELLPQQKLAVTNEIHALRRLLPLSWSSNYVTCLANISILLSNHAVCQLHSSATTCQVWHDQTLSLSVRGVDCETMVFTE